MTLEIKPIHGSAGALPVAVHSGPAARSGAAAARQGVGPHAPGSGGLMETIDSVRDNLRAMYEVNLNFSVDDDSGRLVVRITDEKSGKVIRQIPPDDFLHLAAKIDEMLGLIFHAKG